MKKLTLILTSFLAGVIVFQFLFYKCERNTLNKRMDSLTGQLQACINAPVKTDTIIRTDTLKQVIKLPFTYTVIKTDTAWMDTKIEQREYTGTYVHPQFEVHWTADVTGSLNSLTINPPSLIKSLVITKEKTVDLTQYQTNLKPEKSHLYTTLAVGIAGKNFWGTDVGLQYIRKEGWGIGVGISTDFDKLIYKGGVIFRLK